MIFSKDKQAVQELLAHRGWDIFRSLLFQDHMMDNRQNLPLTEKFAGTELPSMAFCAVNSSLLGLISINQLLKIIVLSGVCRAGNFYPA